MVAGRLAVEAQAAAVLVSGCPVGSPESLEHHSAGAAVSVGWCRRDLALR